MASPRQVHPSPVSATILLAVALGGAVGACARVVLGELAPSPASGIPWTTLGINVLGCGLLALLPALDAVRRHPVLPPMLGTGVLGGFTTLSAWSGEANTLLDGGEPWLAAGYALGTLLLCLGVVALVDRLSSPADRSVFEAEEGDL